MRLLLFVGLTLAMPVNLLSHSVAHAAGAIPATIAGAHHSGDQERCHHPPSALGAMCSAASAVLLPSNVFSPIVRFHISKDRRDIRDETDAGRLVLPPVPPPRI